MVRGMYRDISCCVAYKQLVYPAHRTFLRCRFCIPVDTYIGIFVYHPYRSRKSGLPSPGDVRDPGDFIPPAANQEVESPLGTRYYDNILIFICNRVLDLGSHGGQRGGGLLRGLQAVM